MPYAFGFPPTVTSGGGAAGASTVAAPAAATDANGATITGSALALEIADATHPGIVTAGTQTFAGFKTFANGITANQNITFPNAGQGVAIPTNSANSFPFTKQTSADNLLTIDTTTGAYAIHVGVDASSNTTLPTGVSILGPTLVAGGTADQAGVNTVIQTGSGKGAGTPPKLVLAAPTLGTTGTALNAPATIATIGYDASLGAPGPGVLVNGGLRTTGEVIIGGQYRLNNNGNIDFGWGGANVALQSTGGAAQALTLVNRANSEIYLTQNTVATAKSIQINRNFALPSAANIVVAGTTAAPDWTTGSTQTIDISGAGGNVTATFSNPVAGGLYTVIVLCKAATTFTFAGGTFRWAGSTAPTITATTGKIDVFHLNYDGTQYLERTRAQNQ